VIPQRIKLRGFLCYKDEQEIEFDGNATLWMLSGLNGSGKSSIFDAVTYALFGHHRGGGTHAHELINKDSDSLAVEFDFLLEGHSYRVKRTLRRDTKGGARGTQQIFRFEPGVNSHGKWMPLEDKNQKREFDAWVGEKIGLTYETFTSSVLLLQGKAEKLLDSKPEGRRAVLASIVDIERYERLHARADDQRKAIRGKAEALGDRLKALPEVSPEEVAAAEERIAAAEEERRLARAEVERLQGLEYQAKGWADLQVRLGSARERWIQAQKLLVDADTIERDVQRLRELREVSPRLSEIALLRGQAHRADVEARELGKKRQQAADVLAERDSALKQSRDKRLSLQKLIAADEDRQKEVAGELRKVTAQLEKLKEYERQASDLSRVQEDLKLLPGEPMQAVARARETCETLAALAQTVPVLARFQTRREELRQALGREETARVALQQVQERGTRLAGEVSRLKPLAEEAARALQQANDQATEARTLLQQARDSLAEVTHLDGAKVCRHCGQALTPGHVKEEKRRRANEVRQAEERAKQASEAQRQARTAEQAARDQLTQADKAHQEARLEYRDGQNQAKQARADVERLQAECGQLYRDLPESFRLQIAPTPPQDWLATRYPTADDLDALRNQADGLPAARRSLQEAEKVQQRWGELKARESACLATLNRLRGELPPDHEKVRADHAGLDAEEKALDRSLSANRKALKDTDANGERLTRERDQAQAAVSRLDTQIKEQELGKQMAQQTITKQVKALPANWQPVAEQAGLTEVHAFDSERQDLETKRTDERGRELQQARLELDVLRQEVESLEARQAEVPEEARQDPAILQERVREARRLDRLCDEKLGQERQQRALLENYRQQREKVQQEHLQAEAELQELKLLSELLGRDRLQLYLVRQAERQVVEHANAVLDRLSGGQLYLRLNGEANGEGSSAKALELEAYNRSTGEKPINVAFLSGSQKFRVAVSLALGIGQYASRQHRPIESVIIDEGFGCLDSQGRQVMIQELQNLRSQMRCILLVSHQEDFAEAFSDGYHFELDGGATRVKRFQK
jgi:exonuclease SbcC